MKCRASTLSWPKLFRSAPAEKNLGPAPVITAAYTVRSALSVATSRSSVRRLSGVHVLAGGLSIVMKAVWPRISCFILDPRLRGGDGLHVLQDYAREILPPMPIPGMLLVDLLRERAEEHGVLRRLRGI